MSWALMRYVLKAAARDKVIISLMVALALSCALSVFMGSVAVIEQDYFSIVFAASGSRISIVFGLVLFVVFYIRRSFEAKDIEFILSRPLSRVQFLLSYIAAFVVLAVLMGVVQGGCIYAMSGHLFSVGHWYWIVSVIAENMIMVSVALFFSMILSSAATAALACFGFYALARMMGHILGALDGGTDLPGGKWIGMVLEGISVVTPRLDLMAQSSWLIYGVDGSINLAVIILQGFIFSAFIFFATSIDLIRRQF